MGYRLSVVEEAQEEFLVLLPAVRATFEKAFEALEESSTPLVQGEGYFVEPLHLREEIWPGGVYSLHVHKAYRGFFLLDGVEIVFGGFGLRPGFYARLRRLRAMVEARKRTSP